MSPKEDGRTREELIEALAASRERETSLWNLLEGASIGITVADGSRHLLMASKAVQEMLGYTAEELAGQDLLETTHPADREQSREIIRSVEVGERDQVTVRKRYVRKDGSVVWAHATISALRDPSLGVAELLAEKGSETDGCRNDLALKVASAITAQSPHGVIATDPDHRITYANPEFEVLFGYEEGEVLGRTPEFLIAKTFVSAIQAEIRAALARGEAWQGEVLSRRKNGSVFPCDLRVFPLVDGEGKVFAHGSIQEDIGERKRREEDLHASELRLRAIMETSQVGYFRLDREGTFTEVNQGWLAMHGYHGAEEILGRHFAATQVEEDLPAAWEVVRRVLDRGDVVTGEFSRINQDGSVGYHTFTARPVRDVIGIVGIEGFLMDITELKLAQRELEESRDRLRSLAKRLDEIREEERGSIACQLHDDVGQNLTAMRMDLRALERELPDGMEALADRIRAMMEITQDSVDQLNRLSFELRSPILKMLGLRDAVESEVILCQERLGFKIELALPPDDFEPHQERDLAAFRILKEALANLATHSQATAAWVRLEVEGQQLVLEVQDNGVGISRDRFGDPRAFGLRAMEERALRLGGRVAIGTRRDGGTRVLAVLPRDPP